MRFLRCFPVLAVAVSATVSVPPLGAQARSGRGAATTSSESVLVRSVLDGDTIDVHPGGRVRLLGIDAPEVGRGYDSSAPFAREARERLAALVLHRWVRLQQDRETVDVYNRRLAYVITENGSFVNAVLVREGLARVSARLPLVRLDELKRAEAEAQTFRRGMWGAAPPISPQPGQSGGPVAPAPARRYTAKSGERVESGRASGKGTSTSRAASPTSTRGQAQQSRPARRKPRKGGTGPVAGAGRSGEASQKG